MMKFLKYINELPLWGKLIDVLLAVTLIGLFSLKVAIFVAILLLFLVLNSKPGE